MALEELALVVVGCLFMLLLLMAMLAQALATWLGVCLLVAAASIVQGVASNASDGESTCMWAPYTWSLVVYGMYAAVTVCCTVC